MTAPELDDAIHKSDPRGGIRSKTTVAVQEVGQAGFLISALQILVTNHYLTPETAFYALGILGATGTVCFKVWADLDGTARMKHLLDKVGLTTSLLLIVLLVPGCAIQVGKVVPHSFTSITGETLIACDVTGISWSVGDADICRNVEGGHVSRTFADMTLGVVRTAGAIIAGFFGGAGAGVQAALAPDVPATPLPASSATPAPATSDVDLTVPTPSNPFTAPR